MEMPLLTQKLEGVGLSEREARVYLSLLELGESSALQVAEKTNIKRTNTYDILRILAKKGLVTYLDHKEVRRFVAEDPASMERLLRVRLEEFSQLLPELRSIHNAAPGKPRVRFFEGKKGLLAIYEEMEESPSFDALGSPGLLFQEFASHFESQGKRTIPKQTRIRELITPEIGTPAYAHNYTPPLQEIRFLPAKMKLTTDMVIYTDKLALFSYHPDIHAVVIEGSSIVDSHKQMFSYMWEMTPSIH